VNSARRADVFVDVCTQRDYLATGGAAVIANAHPVVSNLKHLMAFARWARVPTVSCVETQRLSDVRGLPRPCCVVGAPGQQKLSCTLLPERVLVDSDNCLCISLDIFQEHQQAILAKEHRDPFTNPKLDRLMTELPVRRFVVFGVALESTIRLLSLGLLLRHRRVAVVYDACGWWNREDGEMALRQLAAKGCELLTAQQLIESTVHQYRRNGQGRALRRRSVA
jgi:nicotinamidase-related amidase